MAFTVSLPSASVGDSIFSHVTPVQATEGDYAYAYELDAGTTGLLLGKKRKDKIRILSVDGVKAGTATINVSATDAAGVVTTATASVTY